MRDDLSRGARDVLFLLGPLRFTFAAVLKVVKATGAKAI